MTQRINDKENPIKRLFAKGDKSIANLKKIKKDMEKDGVIGFCNKCGCNKYADRKHECK